MKKNKQGKYGVKMTRLEPGDLRYWGSDIFQRLEQQVEHNIDFLSMATFFYTCTNNCVDALCT